MNKAARRRGPAFKKLLIALSFLFALVAFGRLLVVFFNVHPYFTIGDSRFGLVDYAHGIPVDAATGRAIANTSVKKYYANGWSLVSLPGDGIDHRKPTLHEGLAAENTESISAHYKAYNRSGEISNHVPVNRLVLKEARFYIKPEKLGYKLYYTYPDILNSLVASFCFWLLAQFISAIQMGEAFTKKNRLRLQTIGWAVLAVQFAYFIVEFVPPPISYLDVSYTATIPGFRSNFDFRADPIKPFSTAWLFVGALIVIVASAFRDGEMLQEDKDLTI